MPVSQQYESQGCGTGKRWGQQGEEEGVCVCVCVYADGPKLTIF